MGKTCERDGCSAEFVPGRKTQRFCSPPCRTVQAGREQRARQRERRVIEPIACEFCRTPFAATRTGQRFCSEQCRDRRRVQSVRLDHTGKPALPGDLVQCGYCDDLFELPAGKGQHRYCSSECRREARSARLYPRELTQPCVDCGTDVLQVRMGKRRERCPTCLAKRSLAATQDWIRRNPDRARDLWAKGRHKRRALLRALPNEPISPLAVYERDGWTCGICGEPIDPETRYPDPLSPSLDHVTPLSRGGHHVLTNVQAAHLLCNVLKNDSVEAGA